MTIRSRELSQFGSFILIDDSTQRVSITTSLLLSSVGIGTTDPQDSLHISQGNVRIDGDLIVGGNINYDFGAANLEGDLSINVTGIITAADFRDAAGNYLSVTNSWRNIDIDIYRLEGNVGIGTSVFASNEKLKVSGNVKADTITANTFISTVTNSPPFSIQSNQLVQYLNADFLRGFVPGGSNSGDIVTIDANQILINKTLTAPIFNSSGVSFRGTTGITTLRASSSASGTLTLPATTGTLVSTGDIGVITSNMIGDLSITNADIATGAAIAYSKLSLSNSIVNSDIVTGTIANNKLVNSTISGVSLGSALAILTRGSYLTGSNYNGSAATTWAVDATSASAGGASKIVARDASGNFGANSITLDNSLTSLNVTCNASGTLSVLGYLADSVSQVGAAGSYLSSTGSGVRWVAPTTISTLTFSGSYWSGGTTFNGSSNVSVSLATSTITATPNTLVARDAYGSVGVTTLTASSIGVTTITGISTITASNIGVTTIFATRIVKTGVTTTNVLQAGGGDISITTSATANTLVLRDAYGSTGVTTLTASAITGVTTISSTGISVTDIFATRYVKSGVTTTNVLQAGGGDVGITTAATANTLVLRDAYGSTGVTTLTASAITGVTTISSTGISATDIFATRIIKTGVTTSNVLQAGGSDIGITTAPTANTLVLRDAYGSTGVTTLTASAITGVTTISGSGAGITTIFTSKIVKTGVTATNVLQAGGSDVGISTDTVANTLVLRDAYGSTGITTLTASKFVKTGATSTNLLQAGGGDISPSSFSVPTGIVLPYGNITPPSGWLLCDGSNVSRTTYASLFAVIGTKFGSGDGSTTFTLPNMDGYFPGGTINDSGSTNIGYAPPDAQQPSVGGNVAIRFRYFAYIIKT